MYLIRAKFSLIYVVTWEERRVIQSLERIANRNEVNVCGIQTWDAVRGLTTSEGIRIGSDDLTHPMAILDYICRSVEESRKKKEEIQSWKKDKNKAIQLFVKEYEDYLDIRILYEKKQADESIELRKRRFDG